MMYSFKISNKNTNYNTNKNTNYNSNKNTNYNTNKNTNYNTNKNTNYNTNKNKKGSGEYNKIETWQIYNAYRQDQYKLPLKHNSKIWEKKPIYIYPTLKSTNSINISRKIKNNYDITTQLKLPNTNLIPLNIFQTWHTNELPPKMKLITEKLKNEHPNFSYYLYTDDCCRKFLKEHFDSEVLYTYNKLLPGAYKADLWRYCILYIYGGIYLDIKMQCINNFNLLLLTNKEYFVRDRKDNLLNEGIWQGLIVSYPKNEILKNCIFNIIENVKQNYYGINCLCSTGPFLINKYFNSKEISDLQLYFNNNNSVEYNKIEILQPYKSYREDQQKLSLKHYGILWQKKQIYIYPTLKSINSINISRKINRIIFNKPVTFFSSTPSIVKMSPNKYLINLRWINYNMFNDDGKLDIKKYPKQFLSLNSRFYIDENLKQISNEYFLDDKLLLFNKLATGIEDIRITTYNNNYYYSATCHDSNNKTCMTSGIYDIHDNKYELSDQSIHIANIKKR